MYSVWVTVEVVPGRENAFLEAIKANAAATVADEPGCSSFDVVELEPGRRYGFYEVYDDEEAFTVAHRSAPHYAAWRRAVDETIAPGTQIVTRGPRIVAER
ncbi:MULTISPECIES: putative quinol monooxygenase [unclassified Curtobacterium]|uniref:putative quinol monooxygenase n=1 Tax=unclassified Curtobacterium TaxID=257496 RepID=UPI0008DCA570|nr:MULTISPECIES: putative quinol monooxygenase [unclassified Curtobacterium]OIH92380.1 hypothetical protein BIU90_10790 [Curtobacterium sp. MCBA15_001]WIA96965.1 putative quinol monooxygenase [Curtobacterium sp. MCBA15_004]WIB00270.1 putative quinol monooxygenase [Curtobacterium sp. MCBA15_012]